MEEKLLSYKFEHNRYRLNELMFENQSEHNKGKVAKRVEECF